MSRIVVQKFGGSSVADAEKLRKVAQRVKARRDEGWQVVVVVSAMGDTTDELLGLARQISADPPRRELDMLLTCGERISMALLCMALSEVGVPAISFTGSQSGIITDEAHAQARIIEVRPMRVEASLAQGKVVIVAGYQGVSRSKEVTTLGRGGSDTTAVAMAAALGADCEIYSDVDGVYSADPRVVPEAKKLEALSYDEMQALAVAGAKVLNAQAVEFAKEKGIVLSARSTHQAGTGTTVHAAPSGANRVKGITSDTSLWVLDAPSPADALLAHLDARQVRATSVLTNDAGRTLVVVPLEDVHGAAAFRASMPPGVRVLEDAATVTCVGTGLAVDTGVLRRMLVLAREGGFPVYGATSSGLQVALLTSRAAAPILTRAAHQIFIA